MPITLSDALKEIDALRERVAAQQDCIVKMLDELDRKDARLAAYELYSEIVEAGVLEDRMEYTKEDFALAYPDQSCSTIDMLESLVQGNVQKRRQIS